jgi:hypothetical protein
MYPRLITALLLFATIRAVLFANTNPRAVVGLDLLDGGGTV